MSCAANATSTAGATESSECNSCCRPGFYDVDTAVFGVNCVPCRTSCGTGQYVSSECGAVDVAHGQDASCTRCPAHSTLSPSKRRRTFGITGTHAPMLQDCICDAGFYDQQPALSKVSCVTIPMRFGAGANKTARCQVQKFGLGRKAQIKLDLSPSDTAQLGAMDQYLGPSLENAKTSRI